MKTLLWGAINPFTGTPFTFDDPNLRWGSPSYYLEPGDPGFAPYPGQTLSVPTQKPKRNRMAKSDYIDPNDDKFVAQLKTFQTGIGSYAATLGVTPAQVTSQAADADYMAYIVSCQEIAQGYAQQLTAWKNFTRGGGLMPPAGAPVPPVFPAPVPAVPPGVEIRFRALVRLIKAHPNYNDAIGQTLGIEGAVSTGPDLAVLQAVLTLSIVGNAVFIGWGWQGFSAFLDMLEIQVDRGDGKGFVLLTYDTTPNYTDTFPLPATPTKWKYRAIYRVGDHQVGVWSNTVEIVVGG
jgi:hypothetical protein